MTNKHWLMHIKASTIVKSHYAWLLSNIIASIRRKKSIKKTKKNTVNKIWFKIVYYHIFLTITAKNGFMLLLMHLLATNCYFSTNGWLTGSKYSSSRVGGECGWLIEIRC